MLPVANSVRPFSADHRQSRLLGVFPGEWSGAWLPLLAIQAWPDVPRPVLEQQNQRHQGDENEEQVGEPEVVQ